MAANGTRATAPLVTVSLVTYNGMRWLAGCLESLRDQHLSEWELLVLDNASTDGTVEWLREAAASDSRIGLTGSPANLGFAVAHNRQIFRARAPYVLLLNQDVELDSGFLRAAIGALEQRPKIGAVQGQLRRLAAPGERTDTLDSTGLVMHRDRRVVSRRQGERQDGRDLVPGPVWGADGPAPIYRRVALLDARLPRSRGGWEILDEDFFMYKEDVDLAWRLRLLGWQAWYEPTALAWHARTAHGPRTQSAAAIARASLKAPPWVRALSWRNHRLMQLKNERLADVARDLPAIAQREVLSFAFLLVADRERLHALSQLTDLAQRAASKRPHVHVRRHPTHVSRGGPR